MGGPETLYVLDVPVPLTSLELSFGAAAEMRLFLLSGQGAVDCLAMAGINGAVAVPNVAPGRYYLVADGYTAGAYFFSIHCQPVGPAATATATPTMTATPTRTPTATITPTPTITPTLHVVSRVYLPLMLRRPVSFGQPAYWSWLEQSEW